MSSAVGVRNVHRSIVERTTHGAEESRQNSGRGGDCGDHFGYAENAGGFLSLGASWPSVVRTTFFTVATGFGLLALAVVAIRRKRNDWSAVGLALLVAGGSSNWIDRVCRGSVVDFLNVAIGAVRTGVFNVADVAIMLGAAVLLIAELRNTRQSSTFDHA